MKKWYLIVDGTTCKVVNDKAEYENINVVIIPIKPNEAATILANTLKSREN